MKWLEKERIVEALIPGQAPAVRSSGHDPTNRIPRADGYQRVCNALKVPRSRINDICAGLARHYG